VVLGLVGTLTFAGFAGLSSINPFTNIGKSQVYASGIPELTEVESVEDEFGSYKRTTIKDTSSITSTTDSTKNKEDGAAAKAFVLKFIVEEALDSIALDNESQWSAWKTNVAPKYLHPDYIDEILGSEMALADEFGGVFGGKGIVLTDAGDSMPTLKRDGGPRSTDKLFKDFLIGQDATNPDIIYVYTTGSSFYNVTDEDAKKFIADLFGDNLFDSDSSLNDGRDQNLQVDFNLSYTLKRHNGEWKIAGFSNGFQVLTGGLRR
jgi:hypothetical protein